MLNKLERKIGKYAIKNLMYYLVFIYVLGSIIFYTHPSIYFFYLSLDFSAIFRGEVWRLITFLMAPISTNIISTIITIIVYYFLAKAVENVIGSFRFNIFIFSGIILTWVVALVFYFINFDYSLLFVGTRYLNLSIYMLFALVNPEALIGLYFVIPIKAKWLAVIEGIYFIYGIMVGGFERVEALATVLNLLLMVCIFKIHKRHIFKYDIRNMEKLRNKKLQEEIEKLPKHRCCICGITEKDDPDMEFRYCSKCSGLKEYCMNHINNHEHN